MSIPTIEDLLLPTLQLLADGKIREGKELTELLAEKFALTEEEKALKHRSGYQFVFANRTDWAKAHLKRHGLIERPLPKTYRITAQGERALSLRPPLIDLAFLKKHFPLAQEPEEPKLPQPDPNDPEEVIEVECAKLRQNLASELLERLRNSSPQFFEYLVVKLLLAMGYGGSFADAGKVVGGTGDGGIYGVIRKDPLGLDVLYIQAKHWTNPVGGPVVQQFLGSLETHHARKGVLITTSKFTADAWKHVRRLGRKVILMDGRRLVELMMDYGVGVRDHETYVIKRVDEDFFTERQR